MFGGFTTILFIHHHSNSPRWFDGESGPVKVGFDTAESGPRQVWCAKRAREPANLGSFLCQVMSRARVSSGLPHGCTVIPREKKRYSFLSASTQQTSWFFIETSSFVFQRRLVRRSGLRRPYRTVAFSVFSRVQSCARRSIHWEGKGKPSCDV